MGEQQSLTPKKLNETANELKSKVKENLNYIAIGLVIIVNILLSILQVKDGKLGVNTPKTTLGWILLAGQIVLATCVGVMILFFFRRQGIRSGHKEIKDIYNAYLEIIRRHADTKKPRSLKQFMGQRATRDIVGKSFFFTATSIVVGTLIISANWNGILSLVINTIIAIAFGIMNLLDAESFVIEELSIWYSQQIEILLKKEKEEENAKHTSRNKQTTTRCSIANRIQQEKECRAGQRDIVTTD